MMRGRTPVSPKEEEDDPVPKRSRRDVDDEGKERVKLAIQEQVQALAQLVDNRRTEVEQAEEEVRKAESKLGKARKRLAEVEAQLERVQSRLTPTAALATPSNLRVKTEQDPDTPSRDKIVKEIVPSSKPPLVIPGSNEHSSSSVKGGPTKRLLESRSSLLTTARSEVGSTDSGRHLTMNKMKATKGESGGPAENRPVKKRPGIQTGF